MSKANTIYLAISLDVEEEGLFTGRYACQNVTCKNTASLVRLQSLFNLGVRPTLFTAYSVFNDQDAAQIIKKLQCEYDCEIAAHLHFWNTPPLDQEIQELPYAHSLSLSDTLFAKKLEQVLTKGFEVTKKELTAFRMGRWDIHKNHWPILAKAGLSVDASVRPLHGANSKTRAPDHFNAPNYCYLIPTAYGQIFEVPLTVTPLFQCLPACLNKLNNEFLKAYMNYYAALALLPVYQPLFMLKAITKLYLSRGGQVLSLTWHSSEMHAGATPHLPTNKHVDKLMQRIFDYVVWLKRHYQVESVTMTELKQILSSSAKVVRADQHGDYSI